VDHFYFHSYIFKQNSTTVFVFKLHFVLVFYSNFNDMSWVCFESLWKHKIVNKTEKRKEEKKWNRPNWADPAGQSTMSPHLSLYFFPPSIFLLGWILLAHIGRSIEPVIFFPENVMNLHVTETMENLPFRFSLNSSDHLLRFQYEN
jgi:hypothetical protein